MKHLVKLVAMAVFVLGCNDLQASNPRESPLKSIFNDSWQQRIAVQNRIDNTLNEEDNTLNDLAQQRIAVRNRIDNTLNDLAQQRIAVQNRIDNILNEVAQSIGVQVNSAAVLATLLGDRSGDERQLGF